MLAIKNHLRLFMRNILIFLVFAALAVLAACQSGPDRQRIAEGEQLSKSYCIACHAYPDPGLLDRATWEKHVLPRMGYFTVFTKIQRSGNR